MKKKIIENTEFPPYCIMDGDKMILVKMAGVLGLGKSENGCKGCGINKCFGNAHYKKPLDEYQKKQVDDWWKKFR